VLVEEVRDRVRIGGLQGKAFAEDELVAPEAEVSGAAARVLEFSRHT
jgi:hypothetical protein